MKSILLPVHPEILERILNGDADTLIKKLFPKDYVGWVYLYCAKKPYLYHRFFGCHFRNDNAPTFIGYEPVNGFVVARFWCNKVERIYFKDFIHISKLEVFEKPRELNEFRTKAKCDNCRFLGEDCSYYGCLITKAPSNYCYIESEK